MARIARVVAPLYPHHITQRGNRRQQTFFNDEDYLAYLELMSETRPVIIVSNNIGNTYSGTVTIIPVTSKNLAKIYPLMGHAFLIVVIEGMGMWMAALGIAKSFCWGYYALMNQRNPWEAKDYDKRNNQAKNESSRY